MEVRYIDIHSHLNDPRFEGDRDKVLARMREVGVATITVGTDKKMSEDAISIAESSDMVWATIGQHPVDKPNEVFDEAWYREVIEAEIKPLLEEYWMDQPDKVADHINKRVN